MHAVRCSHAFPAMGSTIRARKDVEIPVCALVATMDLVSNLAVWGHTGQGWLDRFSAGLSCAAAAEHALRNDNNGIGSWWDQSESACWCTHRCRDPCHPVPEHFALLL